MSTADQANRPPDVVEGEVVGGKWRIGPLIGRGGMGTVHEGTNISIGKKVALKFIDAEFAKNPDITSRFQREAEAASLVESAHIVHIFDSGTTDRGLPYIVMELLRGEDLRGRINRIGRIPNEEAVHIVAQTLRGLHRAHEAGIVHRDLKPDNIFLVDRDDDPLFAKIVDFGISKMTRRSAEGAGSPGTLTRQGVVLGTPYYMSPEQAQAFADLDLRTDLWSVGAILFECLAGRPPFTGDAYEQIIIAICTTDAPDVRSFDFNAPAPLADFIARALSRDRAQRFQTAKEMLDALSATGIAPVRTLGVSGANQGLVSGAAVSGAGRAIDAASGPGENVGAHAPSGRTRVSWTAAGAKSADGEGDDDARGARAHGVRRRGLIALGGVVAAAAFLLTFGLLRPRGGSGANGDGAATNAATGNAAGSSSSHLASTGAAPAANSGLAAGAAGSPSPGDSTNTAAPSDSATADRAPGRDLPSGARHGTAPPGAKPRRGAAPPTNPVGATPPPSPPTAAPAASSRAGVAGGLQIKTSYP